MVSISTSRSLYICPVCLDLLTDPVTVPCGRSFCKVCINGCWDQTGVYSCPECGETFPSRLVSRSNKTLIKRVNQLKGTKPQAAHCSAGPGDVQCDSCTGRKRKAVKFCLVCLAFYCEDHLKPHFQSPAFKKHKLVEACAELQEKICPEHDKLMEIFCRTDQSFICYSCMMEKHKGHDMERGSEKQNEPKEVQTKSQQRIQKKEKKIQELKQTEDIIKSFPSLRVPPGCDDSSSFTLNQHLSFDAVKSSVSDLKKQVEEKCEEKSNKIYPQDAAVPMISPSESKSREEFVQYFRYLTLDPNTAHRRLVLSEQDRAATYSRTEQRYSRHPERFHSYTQVLCKESVCERCYWEVERSGNVSISVSYKEIGRKEMANKCLFGYNSQSWSLRCSSTSLSFWHKNAKTELQAPASSRIGVYVDHGAGTLSFYSVSDTMTLIHRVQTTFSQPLYAGFRIWYDSAVRLCELS